MAEQTNEILSAIDKAIVALEMSLKENKEQVATINKEIKSTNLELNAMYRHKKVFARNEKYRAKKAEKQSATTAAV